MDEFVVREENIKGYTVKVVIDENPMSPREDDNFGFMVCWHRRHNLGDGHKFDSPDDFLEFEKENKLIKLPLFLYDHSGITISTGSFNDRWDSGQVGWIYATYEQLKKEYSTKKITKKILEKAYKLLTAEVETYDQYLTGQIYGYVVEETGDSCWGFYDKEECFQEGKNIAEFVYHEKIKKHTQKVKSWIINKVPLYARTECPIHS